MNILLAKPILTIWKNWINSFMPNNNGFYIKILPTLKDTKKFSNKIIILTFSLNYVFNVKSN